MAMHYYKCKQDFQCPHSFSPVPYFLLCRAIELELKSRHLRSKTQKQVKDDFGHDLLKAYESLSNSDKILNADELCTLKKANDIYSTKGFEYFDPEDALRRYSNYPNLESLDLVARKLIGT